MNISPQFVPLEIAKLLKEKGFDVKTSRYYNTLSNRLLIENDPIFPVQNHNGKFTDPKDLVYSAPEVWQVVEWLYYEHHIWIKVDCDFICFDVAILRPDNDPIYLISTLGDMTEYTFTSSYDAYLGAIDYVLNKLI